MKRWNILRSDPARTAWVEQQTGLTGLACDILQARGLGDGERLEAFFSEEFGDPMLLPDMQQAVERVQQAVDSGESICVYGDYDCDGITSTVLLYTYLESLGASVEYYIPDRDKEGYGMNCPAVAKLAAQGVTLIVTVDNGVSALDEIAYAKELGVDVVVTDHHMPREILPDAVAVVDPHRADCRAPFTALAGVGVVFKLICAMEGGDGPEMLEYFGDLACIGTVADIVPLTGENRTIVRHGLERLPYTENVGLRALLGACGLLDHTITSENVGFVIAPRINAAGRLGYTQMAVDLLLCEDEEEASALAERLSAQNKERQAMEAKILQDIAARLARDPSRLYDRVLVLEGENWHHGIIGIVCSRLVERYGKPCILISVEGEEARGSGRSVEGYSLVDAIAGCAEHLTRYGGHRQAAGFSLKAEEISAFRLSLLEQARREYDTMPVPILQIDRLVAPHELTVEQFRALSALEPFGAENAPPLFGMLDATLEAVYPLGSDGAHIRLKLKKNGASFTAVYFGMTQQRFPFAAGDRIDLAAACDINVYNGEERVSVKVRAVRPAGMDEDALFEGARLYDRCRRGEPLSGREVERIRPTREDSALLYRWLRERHGFSGDLEVLSCKLGGFGYGKLRLALDVMQEMGLAECAQTPVGTAVTLKPVSGKVDLEQSAVLQRLRPQAVPC